MIWVNGSRTCTLLLSLAAYAPADERLERLSREHRDWIEKEVVYIISDREKDAFLDLVSVEEREAFIEAFWRRRDPDPLTPANEFREEHHRRIEYANRYLGREAAVPGWMTDRGRIYITLGEPREREEFTSVPFLYPAELWFYEARGDKGLPPLYLLFFQEHYAGPYRLFNHLLDGPEDLMPSQPLDVMNSRREAYEILQQVNPGLAHATITMRADQGAAAGILQPDRSALDFQSLLADIYASPMRRVDTRYLDAAKDARGFVETEYLFNYVPSAAVAHVLPGPAGTSFVHYAVEIEPQHMTLARDPQKNLYYTRFELKGEVTAADETTVVTSFVKEPYLQLSEAQFREVGARPFAYRDMFPLSSGEYRFRLVFKNRARAEYTLYETSVVVPERIEGELFLGEPVLLYGMSRLGPAGVEESSPYRTYRMGSIAFDPNARKTIAIGDHLMALVPIENAGDDYTLRVTIHPRDESEARPLLDERHRLDFYGQPVVLRLPLEGFAAGRYRFEIALESPSSERVGVRSGDFDVSPLSRIATPWGLRESIEGERVELILVELAHQAMRLGRSVDARRLSERALSSDPNSIPARLVLARLHLDDGAYGEAIRLLEPARAQAPDDVEVLLALGDAHLQSKNYRRAAELFEAAARQRRPDTSLLNALGLSHAQLGNTELAVSYLERSLELSPGQEDIEALLQRLRK